MSDTAAATAATGDPITLALTAAFADAESPAPIDNLTPEAPEETVEEVVEPVEEPEAEPEAEPETTDEPEAEAEVETETPVEDGEVKILTAEEIEAKFARSNTKEGRAYMAQVSAVAREGQEAIAKIGGTEFLEPLAKISTALQNADADPSALQDFFVGIVDASGAETMLSVISQAMYMGFVKADDWAANPETAQLGEALHKIVDTSVQARWGVDSARMAQLVEWEKVGWLDKLNEWVENNYVPQSELDEMLEINSNPVLKKLAQENQALKKQGEKATPKEGFEPAAEHESAFTTFIADSVKPVFEDVILKGSPLKDASTDTPAMKDTKAFIRSALEHKVLQEFETSPARAKLLDDFRKGKQHTATYKSELAKALDGVRRGTKPQVDIAEDLMLKLYGKTRNAKIVPPTTQPTPPAPLPPTVPQSHEAASGPKSVSEVQKNLQRAFEELG
jgi:hypothetical protein